MAKSSLIAGDRPESVLIPANRGLAERLIRVGASDRDRPTPNTEWDVRALVNHVVDADARHRSLQHGATLEDIEATRHAGHLDDDPTAAGVVDSFRRHPVPDRTFRHVTGDRIGRDLRVVRILDVGVHRFDLPAPSTGTRPATPTSSRSPSPPRPGDDESDDTPAQDRLLLQWGRQPRTEGPR